MKKIFTLILALMAFVVGSQTVRAEATKTMEVTVESGINFYDEENKDVQFAITLLGNLGQLSFTEAQQIVSTKTGKVLLTVSEEGIIVVSSDVTSDDDIFYTFTDADREYFKEEDLANGSASKLMVSDVELVNVPFEINTVTMAKQYAYFYLYTKLEEGNYYTLNEMNEIF